MSRKDYIKFAAMFNTQREVEYDRFMRGACEPTHLVVDNMAKAAASIFAADNPNFDRSRFLTACGIPTEGQ